MKVVKISLTASMVVSLAFAGGDMAPAEAKVEPIAAEAEKDIGKIFGQSRTFYIDRTYSGVVENGRSSLATGGYIGYETPNYSGFTIGLAAYGTYGFNIHSEDADVAGTDSYDPSLTGRGFDNYIFLGQAYLNYGFGNTNIKIGRQRLDTPMAGADDARMLPNLFEAAVVSNTDIDNTTLIVAHVTKETVGTFGNIYGGGALGLMSGYGLGINEALSGDFVNMGTVALGSVDADGNLVDNETDGVTAIAALYSGIEGLKLQAWDYIAWDILNAIYLQADYGFNVSESVKLTASAQYINESEIGDKLAGEVDSNYLAAKLAASIGKLSGYVAYSMTGDSDGALGGGVITPWGGMPAFTQGMVTRHQFFANTDTWKVAGTYKLSDLGVKASVYYAKYDVGMENGYKPGEEWSASESGFDIQYNVASMEGLNLRLRANYPRDFAPGLDWDEYRVIVNYSF
jgi:hypothetical protein